MKKIRDRFFKVCSKTGRIRGIKPLKGFYNLLFPIVGIAALLWILIRVIPKPSRINYPCVQTAMPFAAGLIGNIFIFVISALAFFRIKKPYFKHQFIFAALIVTLIIGGGYSDNQVDVQFATSEHISNEPMGIAKGIFPGRVVWVHDPNATNENCNPNNIGDGWFLSKNNNQVVIDNMLSNGLKGLTGAISDSAAWDSVFIFHNRNKGKGNVGYNSEEKIFIKINMVSGWGGNYDPVDLSKANNSSYGISETSPQIVLAVLRQLVNVIGVPQDKIYIGDPLRHIYKHLYDYWHAEFPDIHYLDHDGYTNLGREKVIVSDTTKIIYSDRGKILRTNVWSGGQEGDDPVTEDKLYTIFEDAEYMINLPMLKGHRRAGMTSFAKNHFGSHTRNDAAHLHNGLVAPTEPPNISRPGYGLYRIQTDIMYHEILGEKNLLYIMDALWPSDYEINSPKKFTMAPFNTDWMSSIFLSLDPVAIESVGYDFLRAEFTTERSDIGDGAGTFVQMDGVDDYLHQAADSSNWPDSITNLSGEQYPFAGYDPENDGISYTSLGVHEHWNNSVDKKYTRNLGTDEGIELYKYEPTSVKDRNSNIADNFRLYQNYPNPFNPTTKISWQSPVSSWQTLKIYDALGNKVTTLVDEYKPAGTFEIEFNASNLSSGIYFYQIKADNFMETKKMILLR
jgi:hypothetical protein